MPYRLRPGGEPVPTYTRQQFGGQVGGPLKIPGVYGGARTTFFLNYSGGRSDSLVDQYATVPTAAMRAGDFSGGIAPVDPLTGQPFPNGTIPAGRISIRLRARCSTTSRCRTCRDRAELPPDDHRGDGERRRQPAAHPQLHGRGRARSRRGGGGGGRGGRGGAGRSGTAVVLNAQVHNQHGTADSVNVFPALGVRPRTRRSPRRWR